ncbi:MAG: hypothetical protein COZ18_15780 [Flexibacter sp. CG_4_10_14_3_um_filter_32_15]|nr:MAG: hypothetical protein COZ18_15780 [Flexibacter sp. CG_4_10_14_3_um_filter_32_15]
MKFQTITKFAFLAFFLLTVAFLSSCTSDSDNKDEKVFSYKDFLPPSKGGRGEILLQMDSSKWEGDLGAAVRELYMTPMPGFPQPAEPIFKLYHAAPKKVNDLLDEYHSIFVVLSLESKSYDSDILRKKFSKESLDRIEADTTPYLIVKQDEHAKNQQVVYLIGKDDEQLIKHMKANEEKLREIFYKTERERSYLVAFRGGKQTGRMQRYEKEHGFKLGIPDGYQEAKDIIITNKQKQDSGFVFMRLIDNANGRDRNIFVAYKPYTSQGQLNADSVLAWRRELGEKYMKDPDRGSYVTDQTDVMPYFSQEINFKGHYAIEIRALWKLTSLTSGGPFLGYLIVDEKKNRLYYIEGFIFAPTSKKRDYIREVESILWTFEL